MKNKKEKVMLVSGEIDSLIEERYRGSLESDPLTTIWDTFEVDSHLFAQYEELRLALYDITEKIKYEGRK